MTRRIPPRERCWLAAPIPLFGKKKDVADLIWEAFGEDVPNYVEGCAGSLSVLLERPVEGKIETVNDACGFLVNFWRAIQQHPRAVAAAADWPVSELDLHARHRWLMARVDETFVRLLSTEPEFCDPLVAGWWVWGASAWIGAGWCRDQNPRQQIPSLSGSDGTGVGYGRGINHGERRRDIRQWFEVLSKRLRHTRIVCGDFARVLTPGGDDLPRRHRGAARPALRQGRRPDREAVREGRPGRRATGGRVGGRARRRPPAADHLVRLRGRTAATATRAGAAGGRTPAGSGCGCRPTACRRSGSSACCRWST